MQVLKHHDQLRSVHTALLNGEDADIAERIEELLAVHVVREEVDEAIVLVGSLVFVDERMLDKG